MEECLFISMKERENHHITFPTSFSKHMPDRLIKHFEFDIDVRGMLEDRIQFDTYKAIQAQLRRQTLEVSQLSRTSLLEITVSSVTGRIDEARLFKVFLLIVNPRDVNFRSLFKFGLETDQFFDQTRPGASDYEE